MPAWDNLASSALPPNTSPRWLGMGTTGRDRLVDMVGYLSILPFTYLNELTFYFSLHRHPCTWGREDLNLNSWLAKPISAFHFPLKAIVQEWTCDLPGPVKVYLRTPAWEPVTDCPSSACQDVQEPSCSFCHLRKAT